MQLSAVLSRTVVEQLIHNAQRQQGGLTAAGAVACAGRESDLECEIHLLISLVCASRPAPARR